MTGPAPRDLTAIVESVAKDWHERWVARMSGEVPGFQAPAWDLLDAMSQHSIREAMLPIVTATIRAIDQGDEL